jgi:hypothetical protein
VAAGAAGAAGRDDEGPTPSSDDALEDLLAAERDGAGAAGAAPGRKLWHSSSGSSGW